jgi:O-antigen/teichoic acid export membrane protein
METSLSFGPRALLQRVADRMPSALRDRITAALLVGSFTALVLSSVGQLLTLSLQVLFGRALGTHEYGIYSYAMAWLGVGLILGKLGFDTALVRFVASYNTRNLPQRVLGVWRVARRWSFICSLIAAPLLALAAWKVAGTQSASLVPTFLTFAILLPIATYSELASATLRGLKRIALAMYGDSLVRPLVAAIAFGALFWFGTHGAHGAMMAYALGTVAAAFLTGGLVRRQLGAEAVETHPRLENIWVRFALVLMFANAFLILLYTLDTILIGALKDTTEAGLYAVASRVAILVLFVMNALQSIGAPLFAEAYATDRTSGLRKVVRIFNLVSIVSALPIALVLGFFAEPLLGIFGSGFRAAAQVLQILAAMQVFNVLTGPVGVIMSMTGRQNQLATLLAGGLVVHVVLCVILIPRFGAAGAAWSAFIAHGLWNLCGVIMIRAQLGIDCSALDWLRRPPAMRAA